MTPRAREEGEPPFEDREALRSLLDAIPDGVGLVVEGKLVYANPALCEMLGSAADELEGRSPLGLLHPDDRAAAEERMRAIGSEGHRDAHHYRLVREDGARVDVEISFRTWDSDDRPVTIGFFRDIAEQLRKEQSSHLLGAAVEQSGDAIMVTDPEGTIRYVNPAFEAITGYSSEEAVGRNPRILKSGEMDREFYRRMWDTLKSGSEFQARFVNRRKDGSRYHHDATISPIRDAQGRITHFVSAARDVTATVVLEEQLRQAQKMEAVGELTGAIAHDFNNLLTAILGPLEMSLQSLPPDSDLRGELEDAWKSAQRAASLTGQLLTFSRRSSPRARTVDLAAELGELRSLLTRIVGPPIELVIEPSAAASLVRIDPGHLEQVVVNLVVNARDAMPDGGRIRLATERVEAGRGDVRQRGGREDHAHVVLLVEDEGTGIEASERPLIFDPFFTTKTSGTGLGLSTVHGIVRGAGGFIRVESDPGRGTTFRVYLPESSDPAPDRTEEEEAPTMKVTGGAGERAPTERILVVEDEDVIRRVVRRALGRRGYAVRTAASGREALRILEEDPAWIPDLLLTDVVLADMSGPEIAGAVLERFPGLPVLYTSGYSDHEVLDDLGGHEGYRFEFLEKPFAVERLLAEVQELLSAAPEDGTGADLGTGP